MLQILLLRRLDSTGKPHVSLIWHPWSLNAFDPDLKMLELTFAHARRIGLIPATFATLAKQMTAGQA